MTSLSCKTRSTDQTESPLPNKFAICSIRWGCRACCVVRLVVKQIHGGSRCVKFGFKHAAAGEGMMQTVQLVCTGAVEDVAYTQSGTRWRYVVSTDRPTTSALHREVFRCYW